MPLSVKDGMGAWISDFKKSDAPQFKGKSEKERRDMAIAAYMDAKRGAKDEGYASAAQRKAVWATRADGGKCHPDNKKEATEKPPFEPTGKAQGTVTDKSGAKHTPMSRARDLARKARDMQTKKEAYRAPTQAEIDADKKKDDRGKSRPSMSAKSATSNVYKNMMGSPKKEAVDEVVKYYGNPNKDDDRRNAARRKALAKHDDAIRAAKQRKLDKDYSGGLKKESAELDEAQKLFMFKTKAEADKKAKEVSGKVVPLTKQNFAVVVESVQENVSDIEYTARNHLNSDKVKVKKAGKDTQIHVSSYHDPDNLVKHINQLHKKKYKIKAVDNTFRGKRITIGESVEEDTLDEASAWVNAGRALNDYARKSGGMDKADFEKAATHLYKISKANILQKGDHLNAFSKFFKELDTDVRDRIVIILKQNNLMESVEEATNKVKLKGFGPDAPKSNMGNSAARAALRTVKPKNKENTTEANFDQNFSKRIGATMRGGAGAEYLKKKADQRRARDPDAGKGLGPGVLDLDKARKKAAAKGVRPGSLRASPNTRDPKRLPESTDLSEEMTFKVSIEGLPVMYMSGTSPGDIKQQLRKIVKQPSMIDAVQRVTDTDVKKAFRLKSQGKEVSEAKSPNPEDNEPASPDEKSMAIKQAEFIEYVAKEIADHMKKNKEFPEWMQNKLSALHQKAKDMHSTLGAHGVDESAQIDEISADLAKSYYKKATAPDAYKAASDLGHTKDSMRKAHNRVVGSNKAMDRMYRRDKTYKK